MPGVSDLRSAEVHDRPRRAKHPIASSLPVSALTPPVSSSQQAVCIDCCESIDRRLRTRRPSESSVIGWLLSATVHLALLTLFALLLAPRDIGEHAQMLLELVVASREEQSIELLTIETEIDDHTVVTELPSERESIHLLELD